MPTNAPHYLLLTETDYDPQHPEDGGRWRFVLEPMNQTAASDHGGIGRIEVSEREADVWGERLDLLALVRGLESLDQPSKLTLITSSALIGKQLRRGFDAWIENDWRWERFGQLKPIKDADLWKRIVAATEIHSVECRLWQFSNRHTSTDWDRIEQAQPWSRHDGPHDRLGKTAGSYGPAEFEDAGQTSAANHSSATQQPFDGPHFVPTRTGWTRVTEIDPDRNQAVQFPLAFGETA